MNGWTSCYSMTPFVLIGQAKSKLQDFLVYRVLILWRNQIHMLADVVTTIRTKDIVFGEVDRYFC